MDFIDFIGKFGTEEKIIQHYISIRYGETVTCNHCKSEQVYQRKDRPRFFQCSNCKNDFSIFKDTIFESSCTDLRKWFYAIHLFLNSKKGISGLQLQREIKVTYKTAWRMLKQIRSAMATKSFTKDIETVVEIDETYIGGKPRKGPNGMLDNPDSKRGRGTSKTPVIGVKNRTENTVHARVALPDGKGRKLTGKQLLNVLNEFVKTGSVVMTDEMRAYSILSKSGFVHLKVDHTKEFAKGELHTNGIESFWATLKRGIYGIYHSVSVKYMQYYVDEFCFRYNNRFNKNVFDRLLIGTVR